MPGAGGVVRNHLPNSPTILERAAGVAHGENETRLAWPAKASATWTINVLTQRPERITRSGLLIYIFLKSSSWLVCLPSVKLNCCTVNTFIFSKIAQQGDTEVFIWGASETS